MRRWKRRRIAAAIGVAVLGPSLGPLAAAQAFGAEDDGLLDDPQPAWSVAGLACDTGAELHADGDPASRRFCSLGIADDTAYVLEHTPTGYPDGRFRVVAFDLASGEQRWATDTGPAAVLTAGDDVIIVADKEQVVALDPDTGAIRFRRPGTVAGANRYGTVMVADDDGVSAVDVVTGEVRWSEPGEHDVGAVCRDIVVLVPASGSAPAPFRVLEQHTGELRWISEEDFDPVVGRMACGARSIYTTDGDALAAHHAFDGYTDWVAEPSAGAGSLELYRDVVLVRAGDGSGSVAAVDREDGRVLWDHEVDDLGDVVSSRLRLRRDDTSVFTLDPRTGDVVNRTQTESAPGTSIVGLSGSRALVLDGSLVSAFGAFDLGLAWQLDLGAVPDDALAQETTMLVRTGSILTAYRDAPSGVPDI